jgi:hypothetical protein
MMKVALSILVMSCVLMQTSPSAEQPTASGSKNDTLAALEHQTGWILAGGVTNNYKRWALGFANDPTVDYLSGVYEILGSRMDRRVPVLPKVGQQIRVTARIAVTILDFHTLGEKRRLVSPSAATRPLGTDDDTGCFIEAGTVVGTRC